MMKRYKKLSGSFTMIELMIVVIIVAILASSAVPLYRSAVSRAYESEIVAALGTIRSAQRMYYAQYRRYAHDLEDLQLKEDDFRDMSHVTWEALDIEGEDVDVLAVWDDEEGIDGYSYSKVTMDMRGDIERSE